MGKKAKFAICGIAVVAIGSVLGMSAAKRGKKAVEVRMEPVQKRDLIASVTASGQVRPQTKVDVASDVSGKIIKLSVKEGQIVKAGQFLLQIDPSQPQAAVDRVARRASRRRKAQLAQSQANLEQAQRSYDRSASMKKSNPTLIADEAVEQLRTAVEVDKARRRGEQARRRSGDRVAQRRQERAREDDDLCADERAGDAARRGTG